ncbi:MAG TPA: hypothetical protein VFB63_30110 [Bryobacteraceae bacterium]|jgi:hypothetical protein|nr:hypothetical protein [Bryobacteraceae bacterium]
MCGAWRYRRPALHPINPRTQQYPATADAIIPTQKIPKSARSKVSSAGIASAEIPASNPTAP